MKNGFNTKAPPPKKKKKKKNTRQSGATVRSSLSQNKPHTHTCTQTHKAGGVHLLLALQLICKILFVTQRNGELSHMAGETQ